VERLLGALIQAEALLGLDRTGEARQARRRAAGHYRDAIEEVEGTVDEGNIPHLADPFIESLDGQLALRGRSPEKGEKQLLKIADDLSASPRFDAWGEGLFRLERVAADAARAGRPELSRQIVERMHRIDPDFRSATLPAVAAF